MDTIPIEASLTDIEIIRRVKAHIEQHKNKTSAPFSINGMARLLVLAEIGIAEIERYRHHEALKEETRGLI